MGNIGIFGGECRELKLTKLTKPGAADKASKPGRFPVLRFLVDKLKEYESLHRNCQ